MYYKYHYGLSNFDYDMPWILEAVLLSVSNWGNQDVLGMMKERWTKATEDPEYRKNNYAALLSPFYKERSEEGNHG